VVEFVGAGSGSVITTGTGTVTKTGCIAGNLLLVHLYEDNVAQQWVRSNRVNIEALNGVDNADTLYQTGVSVGVAQVGNHAVISGRVMADGTCSSDYTVGAAGGDITARIYEFSGVVLGTTNLTIGENVGGSGGGLYRGVAGTSTTPGDADVVTGGVSRLALNFLIIQGAQAVGDWTSETGGDWTEAIAEYTHSTGNGATMQLQTASMPTAGTISGGVMTITSAPWGVMGFALIPAPEAVGYQRIVGPRQLAAAAATVYTVPTGMKAELRSVDLNNPSGSLRKVTLSVGSDAAGTRILDLLDIPAGESLNLRRGINHTLTEGEVLQAYADSASVVVATIDANLEEI
jgi:hypothetical protein